ncbi:MAG: homoserine dehydrogenase [Pseudomonadota bacterium]
MGNQLRLGVAGLGTVGAAALSILNERAAHFSETLGRELVVTAVSARDRSRDRGVSLDHVTWFDDPIALATSDQIDVYVELIGGEEGVARQSVEAALDAEKHVVTANKALLAHHGTALAARAESHDLSLKFEAAVAGGIPVIKTMRESLIANRVTRLFGILNGTCNYMLSRMTFEGGDFATILAEAQAAGYAEADPTFDIGGFDAAHKLALLTSLAFGTEVAFDNVYVEGIESITSDDVEAARELGYQIKLLGVALQTEAGIEQRVHPAMVPVTAPIAGVNGVTNCVAIEAEPVGSVLLVGPGAGGGATASSVISDICDIARGEITPAFVTAAERLKPSVRGPMRAHEGGYYIRLSVRDRTGAFAAIATRMAAQNVSLESIVQRQVPTADDPARGAEEDVAEVVMITHETTEAAIREALAGIEGDGHIVGAPQMIRIERFASAQG